MVRDRNDNLYFPVFVGVSFVNAYDVKLRFSCGGTSRHISSQRNDCARYFDEEKGRQQCPCGACPNLQDNVLWTAMDGWSITAIGQ